jgi:hypothetical protein
VTFMVFDLGQPEGTAPRAVTVQVGG